MLAILSLASALTLPAQSPLSATRANARVAASAVRMDDIPQTKPSNVIESDRADFACEFEIPKKGISEYGTAQMRFKPLLASNSELVVVRYDLPFNLAAEPRGRVVAITADGPGGEKEGDILRFCTQWQGNQPILCDVCKIMERQLQNSFDQVVAALVSNDGTYGEDIVLVLERPVA